MKFKIPNLFKQLLNKAYSQFFKYKFWSFGVFFANSCIEFAVFNTFKKIMNFYKIQFFFDTNTVILRHLIEAYYW